MPDRIALSRTRALLLLVLVACGEADVHAPIEVDLGARLDAQRTATVTRSFAVDGEREVHVVVGDAPIVVEAWVEGGELAEVPDAQRAAGASPSWLVPQAIDRDATFTVLGAGEVTLSVFARGTPPPAIDRDRALAWFDPAVLDDPAVISFAGVMAAISGDGHGGALLKRWFEAFAAGPGAGRAAFAQFLGEIEAAQGNDPTAWDLALLPMKVTGIHNRHDLGRGVDCGELRVSIASTHPTFAPIHFIFLFRAPVADDDVTPDGAVHCRGAARRWARLAELDATAFHDAARELVATAFTRDRFLLAESVELSISPWQWRQWKPTGDGFTNPPLFQTIDVGLVNAPGATRDAFLADVAANRPAVAARTWSVPERYRNAVAEVQPNAKAPLPDVGDAQLGVALGMIGCPRCHTDTADFVQTGIDRKPSPFYEDELLARARRLEALDHGEFPPPVPFGPLQPF